MVIRPVIVATLMLAGSSLADEPPLPKPPADVLLPPGAIRRFGEIRFRHPGGISGSALSPDGKLLATAASKSVVVWDAKTGEAMQRFDVVVDDIARFQTVSFSPDGKKLAAGTGGFGDVVVWDVIGGKELAHIVHHTVAKSSFEGCAAFTADGKELAVTHGQTTDFRETETWKVVRSIKSIGRLISPVGPTIIGGPSDGQIALANIAGKKSIELKLRARPNGLALSPDGKTLASFSEMGRLELWSIPDGEQLRSEDILGNATGGVVAYAPDGKGIFLATPDGLTYRDAATLKVISKLDGPSRIRGIHPLSDGDTILVCSTDGLITRVSRKTGAMGQATHERYAGTVRVATTFDRTLIAIGDSTGRIDLWDTTTGKLTGSLKGSAPIYNLAFSSDRKILAVGREQYVELRDLKTDRILGAKPDSRERNDTGGSRESVRLLDFGVNGKLLWIGMRNHELTVWDATTNVSRSLATDHFVAIFSPDGKEVVRATADPGIAFLDPETGKEIRRAKWESEPRNPRDRFRCSNRISAIAFSADGRRLVVATDDGRFHQCDPSTGRDLKVFPPVDRPTLNDYGYSVGVRAMAFSPDGRWLLTGEPNGAVRIWELASCREAFRITGHERQVTFVAFSPSGRSIISAGDDGAVYEWDIRPYSEPFRRTAWGDLASADPVVAYRAGWTLSEDPTAAIRAIRTNLHPVTGPTAAELAKLIARLNADRFPDREEATRTLTELGVLAVPAIKAAAAGDLAPEARERVNKLLALKTDELTPAGLRAVRAVQVLERIGSSEAISLLKEFAAGADGAPLTEEAQYAMRRLKRMR